MVWGKAGSTTKTSASQLLDVTVSSNENNMMLRHIISSGNTAVYYRFNSDTGSNYAYGWSENGGAKSNSASQSRILYDTGGDAGDKFDIGYICNLSSEEKLIIGFQINEDISGAGNAPVRGKGVFKWANTSDSITSINNFNTDQSGNYDTDSNMSVLGSDVTPIAAVPAVGANLQNGSRYEETDTRKMYNLDSINKSGCLIYYNFEQTSGNATNLATTANGFTDGLGSTGDGVNSGATTGQTGKIDNAWSFDGTNDQVDSGSSSDLILTGDVTWASWVNINTTTSSKVITVASIRGDAGSNTEANNTLFSFFIVQNSSPPTLRVFHENGAGTNNQVDFTTSLSEDTWYHIVFTRDVSEKTVKCYIDGSLHGSDTYSNNPTTTTSTLPLRTGGNDFSGAAAADGHFNGLLDEMSIWNRILTADEISALYNSGTGATIDNTKIWQEIGA